MQKSVQRQKKAFGWLVSSVLAVACAASSFSLLGKDAAAETTYNYWHFTEGSGSYAVSLNSQATGETNGYYGVETLVTRTDSTVKNMGVTLNGAVAPMYTSGNTGKTIIHYDNRGVDAPTADAVVVTFTAMSDMTKQISIIGTVRNERTYYTVALTDDITVQDGFALVDGGKTIGAEALSSEGGSITGYTYFGYPMNEHRGAPYGGDVIYHIGRNGIIYTDNTDWTKLANITDETFLSMSKTNLAGSKYKERYTPEYVTQILSAFEKGCTMTITWYGLKENTVDFHLRGYTGYNRKVSPVQNYQWIDGGNVELNQYYLAPIVYQKTNVVYKYKTYKVQDLVGAYSFYPDKESFDVYLDYNISTGSGTIVKYADNPTVSFTEDEYFCIGGHNGKNHWSPWGTYLFKVIEKPTATAKEVTLDVVVGDTCDLSQYFDFTCGTAAYTVEYSVAGVGVIQSPYTVPAAGTYTLTATVTDKYGTTATAEKTITVKPCKVQYASLTLNGDIGLNFYAKLSSKETAPKADIGFADGTKTQCDGTYADGLWRFTYPVAPKDYNKTVSFALTTYNGAEVTAEYSVETYLNNVTESEAHYALCEKTKEYCEAARVYFYGETATATAELEADLSEYAGSISGEDANVTILGATLVLETKTSVRVYFNAENAEGLVCTVDGATAEIKQENGFTYLEVADIAVKDLGAMHTFTIGGITVNYGAISYVQSVANATDNTALDNVVKALYNAFVAGAEYFKAN